MNYSEMLEKFKAMEDALWELQERVSVLEQSHERSHKRTQEFSEFVKLMDQGS
jgi:two-component sensor histidine kinase